MERAEDIDAEQGIDPPRRIAFGAFELDRQDRSLQHGADRIDLGSRYFDALLLLADNAGQLVSKDRFMDEVWRGVPVTDEALTQCIRSLRRALGDDAAAPRFIETVPKHGYRFVAPVEGAPGEGTACGPGDSAEVSAWVRAGRLAGGTTLGGALAGGLGGILYGAIATSAAQQASAASLMLVMIALNLAIGTLGGAGVGIGMALARGSFGRSAWALAGGGAAGGLCIGALGKLLSLDGFALLTGLSPGNVTGMSEGLVVGAVTGGVVFRVLAARPRSLRLIVAMAALAGAATGAAIAALGGRLMAGSLALLNERFPDSHLHVGSIGRVFGEDGLGPVSLLASTALEAAVFMVCIAAILAWLRPRIA